MRLIFFFSVAFLSFNFVFSQCNLTVVDTIHVHCNGESTGGFVLDVSSAATPYSITLSNGLTQFDDPVFSSLLAGDYSVSITDGSGCVDLINIKLKEPSPLFLDLECEGVSLFATVSGGVKNYTYNWSNQNGEIISNDTVVDFEENVMYAFEVIDDKGCDRSDTVYVWADFEVNKLVGEVPFDAYFVNNSSSGAYDWQFGDVGASNYSEPSYTFEEVGRYDVSLLVTDEESSCSAMYSQTLDVQGFEMKGEDDWVDMYDVFTPNSDGLNDQFSFLENHAISSFEAIVYNRWGKKVYEWVDPKAGWLGLNKNGKPVAEGVYFYTMNAVGLDGTEYQKKGVISLYK